MREGFDEFVAVEWPRLVRTLALYLGSREVAEEIAQEAFVRAAARWRRVSRLASPGGWLHRVAMNLATSTLRRRAAERRAAARLGALPVHEDPDTSDRLAVRAAIAGLPADQRAVIVLRHLARWSTAETAAHLGKSEPAVRKLASRGLQRLRESLTEEDVDVR